LESLQRAGVGQLPRVAPSTVQVLASPSARPAIAEPKTAQITPPSPELSPIQDKASSRRSVTATTPSPMQEAPMAKRSTITQSNPDTQLDVIRQEVAACRRCEHLACARIQTVFGVGTSKPRVCFFGEAPGADEDRTGEPFVGRAGQLLTDIIEKGMKLRRSDVYILNVLKCRPPDNRTPTDEEIENCREYFERQFEVLKPEFICCLGATATKALLGPIPSLGRMRKKWFDYRGSRVMVTYHPSYLLRNPAAKKDTWEDIQLLMGEMGLPVEKK
jgi:uracil-DNA glycosylase family 4